jgi:branched-chain amino acid transport system permease protein
MMRAIRDNEDAAKAMGKDAEFRRLEAFIFGAALMGLGGSTVCALQPLYHT